MKARIRRNREYGDQNLAANSTDSEEELGMADEKTILFQGEHFPTFAERGFQPVLKCSVGH